MSSYGLRSDCTLTHSTDMTVREHINSNVQVYTDSLSKMHDQMIHHVNEMQALVLGELEKRYNSGATLPTADELKAMFNKQ